MNKVISIALGAGLALAGCGVGVDDGSDPALATTSEPLNATGALREPGPTALGPCTKIRIERQCLAVAICEWIPAAAVEPEHIAPNATPCYRLPGGPIVCPPRGRCVQRPLVPPTARK